MRYQFAGQVILTLIGTCWCVAIFNRRHEDFETLKLTKEPIDKYIIYGYWFVTTFIAYLMATSGWSTVMALVNGIVDFAR